MQVSTSLGQGVVALLFQLQQVAVARKLATKEMQKARVMLTTAKL
jgi:hypothetical protein